MCRYSLCSTDEYSRGWQHLVLLVVLLAKAQELSNHTESLGSIQGKNSWTKWLWLSQAGSCSTESLTCMFNKTKTCDCLIATVQVTSVTLKREKDNCIVLSLTIQLWNSRFHKRQQVTKLLKTDSDPQKLVNNMTIWKFSPVSLPSVLCHNVVAIPEHLPAKFLQVPSSHVVSTNAINSSYPLFCKMLWIWTFLQK